MQATITSQRPDHIAEGLREHRAPCGGGPRGVHPGVRTMVVADGAADHVRHSA